MTFRLVREARDKGVEVSVGPDLSSVEVELPTPDHPGLLTEIDDALEELRKDIDAETLPDARQAGVVREVFVEGVAEVPAVGQVHRGNFDELAFRADPSEEHDQLQLEEDHRVDAGPAPDGIELLRPVADKREVEFGFQVAVEVARGNEVLQRDGDRLIEAAGLDRAEHRWAPGHGSTRENAQFTARHT